MRVAHPVERHLAKVEVASSSLVTRSKRLQLLLESFLFILTYKHNTKRAIQIELHAFSL